MTRGRRDVTLNLIWRRPTWIRSSVVTRMPSVAGSPLTLTLPALMTSSIARREPRPDCARTFCNFCERAGAAEAGESGGEGGPPRLVGRAGRLEPFATAGVLLGARRGDARRFADSGLGLAAIRQVSVLSLPVRACRYRRAPVLRPRAIRGRCVKPSCRAPQAIRRHSAPSPRLPR